MVGYVRALAIRSYRSRRHALDVSLDSYPCLSCRHSPVALEPLPMMPMAGAGPDDKNLNGESRDLFGQHSRRGRVRSPHCLQNSWNFERPLSRCSRDEPDHHAGARSIRPRRQFQPCTVLCRASNERINELRPHRSSRHAIRARSRSPQLSPIFSMIP